MQTYITTADVDTLLGAGWAVPSAPGMDAARAVLQANAWLSGQLADRGFSPVPDAVKLAGAEVARLAAQGRLYADKAREVTSLEASAQTGTHVKKSFASGSEAVDGALLFALSLLGQWTRAGAGRAMIERA